MKKLIQFSLIFISLFLLVNATLAQQCSISVGSPKEGETLGCGTFEILWTSQNTSGVVKIEYFCDGTWHTLTSNTSDDGSYRWTIGSGTCCQTAQVRISDVENPNCLGYSGAFSIDCECPQECQITVNSPESGETLNCGVYEITWTSRNTSRALKIEYSCDGTWHTIVDNTEDDGSYRWTISSVTCCQEAQVRITDVQIPNCIGTSGNFKIDCDCPPECQIKVTAPTEGAMVGCGPQRITWTSENTSGEVKLEYFCNTSWFPIATNVPDDGLHHWNVPENTCCDSALIRISDVQMSDCSDISDPFRIRCGCEECQITVLSPNGGENINCGEWIIKWTSQETSGKVRIDYLCDTTWYSITSSTPDTGSFTWLISPDSLIDSTCCDSAWIKITDLRDPECFDVSDSAFVMGCGCDTTCEIKVISPNGGETLGCTEWEITWTSEGTSGNVKIEYVCDGVLYLLTPSTPDDGSYLWTFDPNIGTDSTCCERAYVRISDVENPYCGDKSDEPFIIICECDEWFYKVVKGDSIRHGIPDFDQKQVFWQALRQGMDAEKIWTHCGPVAAANCLWWWDSRLEAEWGKEVDLVKPYGNWDDKDTSNVRPFVADLTRRCRTNLPYLWTDEKPRVGTDLYDLRVGINSLLFDAKLDQHLYVHKDSIPDWKTVVEELVRCQDVILLLGIYGQASNNPEWLRIGGHYVTMAGYSSADSQWIGISDPFLDHAEGDLGIGSPPHNAYVHNNSNIVSGPHGTKIHDPYLVALTVCSPYAAWRLPTYGVSELMFKNFLCQNNYRPELYKIPAYADTTAPDSFCVETEYALYVSPYGEELGSIGGVKTDSAGKALEGWKMKLHDSTGNVLDVTFTDSCGRFLFGGLAPAAYTISEGKVADWQLLTPVSGKYDTILSAGAHIRDLRFINYPKDTGVDSQADQTEFEFRLEQNYPNPFNPATTITYQLPEDCLVTLKVYDLLGRELITLIYKRQKRGVHQLKLNTFDLPSGIYFYKIKAGRYEAIKKMIYIQ